MTSPWEEIKLGENAPEKINVVIEIPRGSQNKIEYDEQVGIFKLDRVLYGANRYPLDYGFIPETRSEDGDHLDALVIGNEPLTTGMLLEVRPIGLLKMVDSGDQDQKILAVQSKNPRFDEIKDISDIEKFTPHLLKEIANFFERYKDLQGKKVEIQGWGDAAAAKDEIKKSAEKFQSEKK